MKKLHLQRLITHHSSLITNQKGFTQLAVLILLLAGVGIGTYLVQQRTSYNSNAFWGPSDGSGNGLEISKYSCAEDKGRWYPEFKDGQMVNLCNKPCEDYTTCPIGNYSDYLDRHLTKENYRIVRNFDRRCVQFTDGNYCSVRNVKPGLSLDQRDIKVDPLFCKEKKACIFSLNYQGTTGCQVGLCTSSECGFNKDCKYPDAGTTDNACVHTHYYFGDSEYLLGGGINCPSGNQPSTSGSAPTAGSTNKSGTNSTTTTSTNSSTINTTVSSCIKNPEGTNPASGYEWYAFCSERDCKDFTNHTDCPKNTADPSNVNPGEIGKGGSNWCYGFKVGDQTVGKCLQYRKVGFAGDEAYATPQDLDGETPVICIPSSETPCGNTYYLALNKLASYQKKIKEGGSYQKVFKKYSESGSDDVKRVASDSLAIINKDSTGKKYSESIQNCIGLINTDLTAKKVAPAKTGEISCFSKVRKDFVKLKAGFKLTKYYRIIANSADVKTMSEQFTKDICVVADMSVYKSVTPKLMADIDHSTRTGNGRLYLCVGNELKNLKWRAKLPPDLTTIYKIKATGAFTNEKPVELDTKYVKPIKPYILEAEKRLKATT